MKKGFALIIVAVILLVAGMLVISMLLVIPDKTLRQTIVTQNKIDKIHDALVVYYNANSVLPTPASLTTATSGTTYLSSVITCNSGCTQASDSSAVWIGGVPTRTLNLPDNYAFDEWGNRLVYAVDTGATKAIKLNKSDNTTPVSPIYNITQWQASDGQVDAVIISLGKDGVGGYNKLGNQVTACPATTQGENCNNNKTFIMDSNNSAANYDDLSNYIAYTTPSCPGNVMGCSLWFDASDVNGSGINAANATPIAIWFDKSGYDHHGIQKVVAQQPILYTTAGPNSHATLTFDGSNDSMPLFGNLGTPTNWTSFAIVNKPTTGDKMVTLTNDVSNDRPYSLYLYSDINTYTSDISHAAWYFDSAVTSFTLWSTQDDSVTAKIWKNGSSMTVTTGVTGTGGNFNILGQRSSEYSKGNMSEVIFYPRVLTTTERKIVECFLTDKWFKSGGVCPAMGGTSASAYCTGTTYCQ